MRLHLWHESCNGTSKKDNVFHEMLSHLTGCSAAPNAAQMGGRRERLPCCVTRNVRFWILCTSHGGEHHDEHVVEGDVLAFYALGMSGEGAPGSGKGAPAPSASNAEWSRKKIARGQRHRRVLRARNPWGRCAGQWGRCACSAPSGPNAEWRQKKEWGHHDEDVVEGNVPAFRALRTCMRGCAGQWESAQNVRGKVWGKVGKMRARCTKPGECPVVSKKKKNSPRAR
ncbi:hypothetical protein B0H19DRAFT_1130212 [Mycena capillaripes]|nr:hypothetical protein B0H19DRAFT_1130212 [Mycena capillaripes]